MNKPRFSTLGLAAAAVAVMAGTSAARAAVLTTVPMQGGMVMPMVSYHASDGRIHVMMPAEIPQLTPLLASHPEDSFDPADPWFDALDPSRNGMSFSRRYGFVMDAMSDPLPDGMQMWIRKLSGPPDLKFHRYSGSEPKLFDPIFGTDGATNALYWNGMMFHPVVAAPPGTNSYTATFEVFLRDIATGEPAAGSSSGPLEFHLANVSDGRPTLALSQGMILTWPLSTPTRWVLESALTPDAVVWAEVTNAPITIDDRLCVTIDGDAAEQFYRMRYVP
jgi:hypothetical protein